MPPASVVCESQRHDPPTEPVPSSRGSADRVLIGVINSAGHLRVGVITGNEFMPLNDPFNPAAPGFGSW